MKKLLLLLPALLIALFLYPARAQTQNPSVERAVFAGGCFWCEETAFEGKPGVLSVISGYAGGATKNPTYEEVSSGRTGHAESVEVTYDPKKTSYKDLLTIFWHNVGPTDDGGQFCDRGNQYRSEIFYRDENQRKLAEASKQEVTKTKEFTQPIVTKITKLDHFYPAEEYHQDFYKKSPIRYQTYRLGCGRDRRLEQLWGMSGH